MLALHASRRTSPADRSAAPTISPTPEVLLQRLQVDGDHHGGGVPAVPGQPLRVDRLQQGAEGLAQDPRIRAGAALLALAG
jgi:hypothetical protein